jgi:hypothetical protein
MTVALGIFDLFTYAVPGALQLALFAYVAHRLGWLDLGALAQTPSGILFVALALASYILGHLNYALGRLIDRVTKQDYRYGPEATRRAFLARNPSAHGRAFTGVDSWLLKAAVDLHSHEAAVEIGRFRATGLMLRSSVLPLALSALTAIVETIGSPRRLQPALTAAALFVLAAVIAARRSFQLRSWAEAYTLQLAYWIPDVDGRIESSIANAAGVATRVNVPRIVAGEPGDPAASDLEPVDGAQGR